ncbi:MAG: restriction endonuclease subunit S [Oscillospiraceae bacterium]|nr:restriction endonuclease subunit S [Oscillospiraceae bacterium]
MVNTDFLTTEIGRFPIDWEVVKLGEKAKIFRGGSPRPIQDYLTNSPLGINWIKIGDVSPSAKYILETKEKIIPEGANRSRLVQSGDFILSNSMSFGRPYILRIDGCIHDGWLVIQDYKSHFEQGYLYYFLCSDITMHQHISMAAGSGVQNLNKEKVNAVQVAMPPLPEQRTIATALSDSDAYIAVLEKLIYKKRAVKQGVMQELLTGKWRLPGFSGEWQLFELEQVANIFDNLRIPVAESLREKGQTPYYGANGIQGFVKGYTHSGEFILIAEDGASDLSNYPVRYVSGEIWVNNHAHVLQGRLNKANTRFLAYAMSMLDYQAILVGGTRAKLNGSVLKKIKILLPNVDEQTAIAEVLSNMDAEIDALTAKLNKAKYIKQGMMNELLTGRIRLF